ncbi:MAG: exodeoxyribonuclease VII large subunit [Bacteroidales bacterium]|nr:exodeoxyribonuclease VII large subunit [Bacteroidales bacterium]
MSSEEKIDTSKGGINYVELSDLQNQIKAKIGYLEQWVRVEIESHREVRGHHYFNLIEKGAGGGIAARASGTVWASNAGIIDKFTRDTGIAIKPGITIVVRVSVSYHPLYGLSLSISAIDSSFSIGQRELEKRETVRKLTEEKLLDLQKSLVLPYLPLRIAVVSSDTAAGYGDFVNQLENNEYGYRFDLTLYKALMQGDGAPKSISDALGRIDYPRFDLVVILRGGGADADMFCYDDYGLCRTIALCPSPVVTAIGHERDYHIADMVANTYVKTPTALAQLLIDWVARVEQEMLDALAAVSRQLSQRLFSMDTEVTRCKTNVQFALNSAINALDSAVALHEARIRAADPRNILSQGYVLAVDDKGNILKNVRSKQKGENFSLRFSDGMWKCEIEDVKLNEKNN